MDSGKPGEIIWRYPSSGIYPLQFVGIVEDNRRAGLGTDTDPINMAWQGTGAVCLYRHTEPTRTRRWCTFQMEEEMAPIPGLLSNDPLAADRFRASGRQHPVQDRHANGSLGLLGRKTAGS
jgi:hypothetical protein